MKPWQHNSSHTRFKVDERNFRTTYGEIDLIVQKEDILVFVEVKTRSTDIYGMPETSVTMKKREHLISTAQTFLQATQQPDVVWHIDVFAI